MSRNSTQTFTLEQLVHYAAQPHNADRKYRLRDRGEWCWTGTTDRVEYNARTRTGKICPVCQGIGTDPVHGDCDSCKGTGLDRIQIDEQEHVKFYFLDLAASSAWTYETIFIAKELAEKLFPLFPKNYVNRDYGTDRAQTLTRIVKHLGVSDIGELVKAAQQKEQAERDRNSRNFARREVEKAALVLRQALEKALQTRAHYLVSDGDVTPEQLTKLATQMVEEIERK